MDKKNHNNSTRHWLRTALLVVLVLALVTGCGKKETPAPPTNTPPPPTNTPTPLPKPTDTLVPTNTAVPPTNTPIPPTDTPDLNATAEAEDAAMTDEIVGKIDAELQKIGLSTSEGQLGWYSTGPTAIKVTSYNSYDSKYLLKDVKVADFAIKFDVAWNSTGGLAGCGLMFRSEDDFKKGAHYRFSTLRLSGLPAWDIEFWDFGNWQRTLGNKIQTSRAINQDQDAVNTYILVAQGTTFTVYANGDKLRSLTDSKLKDGLITFLTFQESGETTCTFNNAWLWIYK